MQLFVSALEPTVELTSLFTLPLIQPLPLDPLSALPYRESLNPHLHPSPSHSHSPTHPPTPPSHSHPPTHTHIPTHQLQDLAHAEKAAVTSDLCQWPCRLPSSASPQPNCSQDSTLTSLFHDSLQLPAANTHNIALQTDTIGMLYTYICVSVHGRTI